MVAMRVSDMHADTTKMRHCLAIDDDMLAAGNCRSRCCELSKGKQPMSNDCHGSLLPVLLLFFMGGATIMVKC